MASTKRKSGRRMGKDAGRKAERVMHERKRATVGGVTKKTAARKQAVDVGMTEARRTGKKTKGRRAAPKRSARTGR